MCIGDVLGEKMNNMLAIQQLPTRALSILDIFTHNNHSNADMES